MRQQRVRASWGPWVAVFVLGLAVSASAQGSGALQASAAAQAAPAAVKSLSLDQAVQLALENNLGLQVQRLNPEVQDVNITLARSVWTPNLTAALQASQRNSPVSGFFSGADDKVTRDGLSTPSQRRLQTRGMPSGVTSLARFTTPRYDSSS